MVILVKSMIYTVLRRKYVQPDWKGLKIFQIEILDDLVFLFIFKV